MRIKCPECQGVLSIKHPKPGNYQPKCTDCGKSFRLKITDHNPPKVGIGRIAEKPKRSVNVDAEMIGGGRMSAEIQVVQTERDAARQTAADRDAMSAEVQEQGEIPRRLGGYRILRLLGRGAMGSVYEAKQLSLDRIVALKTIRSRLASNPSSLARFSREAYAAAQLTHHNVIQIYDFGEEDGRHFFSMEWVRGGPLSELIREKGSIDPKLAAGYALQAARGLQFAHAHGMVHRDIKPANLLLSDEGVVKVADLGLVKVPDQLEPEFDVGSPSSASGLRSGTEVTMQGTAVGTPAFMAPEQSADATTVDHRADIYSLGCTLFYLLSGRPPFDSKDVPLLIDQHANASIPNLVRLNARIPEPLQQIVERSMAKRPNDRYQAVADVIVDLESFLGISSDGNFSPTSAQADHWDTIAKRYAESTSMLRLASPLLAALIGITILWTIGLLWFRPWWVLSGPTLLLSTTTAVILFASSRDPTAVSQRVREWVGSLSWTDIGIGLLGTIVLMAVVALSGLWIGMIIGLILGLIAGAGFHFGVIAPTWILREAPLTEAKLFVRDLRIDGADEAAVRLFAARYSGKSWSNLFEDLFGYDALCTIRDVLRMDPSFIESAEARSIRDRFCSMLASKTADNRQRRDHRRLAKIEQRGLQSEGLSGPDARDRAWQMAAVVVDGGNSPAPAVGEKAVAARKRQRVKAMLAEARSGKYKQRRDPVSPIRLILGGQTRFLAGCLLLAMFAIAGRNDGLFDSLEAIDVGTAEQTRSAILDVVANHEKLISQGLAGLLLCFSTIVSGWQITPFAALATAIILLGPGWGIPGFGDTVKPWMIAVLAGIVVYIPGILLGEKFSD